MPEYAIISHGDTRPQILLHSYVGLLFNFNYGIQTLDVTDFKGVISAISEHGEDVKCTILIQNGLVPPDIGISGFNMNGLFPLFCVVPSTVAKDYEAKCSRIENAHVCTWEESFRKGGSFLRELIESILTENGIHNPFTEELSHEELQERVEERMADLDALPTMPGSVARILRLVANPEAKMEELEEAVQADPAILHKIQQAVNSPAIAGSGAKQRLSIKDAIVRLGLREVGALAMQVKLVSGFVTEGNSLFDFRRFWGHSVGSALAADRLYKQKLLPLSEPVEFLDYWIGALMHDIGKLVLGIFFWNHFSDAMGDAVMDGISFREAEKKRGDIADHERIGQLLLLKAGMSQQITDWVKTHDLITESPSALQCLLHIANNFSKEVGFAYPPETEVTYSPAVLEALSMSQEDIDGIRAKLEDTLVNDVKQLLADSS